MGEKRRLLNVPPSLGEGEPRRWDSIACWFQRLSMSPAQVSSRQRFLLACSCTSNALLRPDVRNAAAVGSGPAF